MQSVYFHGKHFRVPCIAFRNRYLGPHCEKAAKHRNFSGVARLLDSSLWAPWTTVCWAGRKQIGSVCLNSRRKRWEQVSRGDWMQAGGGDWSQLGWKNTVSWCLWATRRTLHLQGRRAVILIASSVVNVRGQTLDDDTLVQDLKTGVIILRCNYWRSISRSSFHTSFWKRRLEYETVCLIGFNQIYAWYRAGLGW